MKRIPKWNNTVCKGGFVGISSVSWIVKWQVVVVSQVRTGTRGKKTGRDNGSACHNSVTKGEFL